MTNEILLIAAPGEKTQQDTWNRMQHATAGLSRNTQLRIPELKVGTLDQLMGLADDLSKWDHTTEQLIRKLVQYFGNVLENHQKLQENLIIGSRDMRAYVIGFQWDTSKYPLKQSLKHLEEMFAKQVVTIDSALKSKSAAYESVKNALIAAERKMTGSLLTQDLFYTGAQNNYFATDYMITVAVVVPKNTMKEWEASHMKFAPNFVVPGTLKRVKHDEEQVLYTVTIFRRCLEDFKNNCREKRFIVREFTSDTLTERDKLLQEKQRQYGPLVRWLKVNFGELFSIYVHIKFMRVFVESVLRFGLPINFIAVAMEPHKHSEKKLRQALEKLFHHLDGSNNFHNDNYIDTSTLALLGLTDYYPYVSFKLTIDFSKKQ